MRRQLAVCFSVAVTILILCVMTAVAQTYSPDNLKNRELILRQTVNTNRKVYVSAGSEGLYYVHENSRLFPVRKPEPVTISDVRTKQDEASIVFRSEKLGRGKIRLYGVSHPEQFDAAIKSAFSEDAIEPLKFILNTRSGIVHLPGANHLPTEDHSREITEAELNSGEFRKCTVCWNHVPRVPSYDVEMRLSEGIVGQVSSRYPLVTDDRLQATVKATGERVLSKWPMPLKGYKYRFYAIDSDITNAFASPGGKIFVTNALIDAMESDEELEAVMAHEIAHVEMRHGYRQFKTLQKAAAIGGFLAALAGGLARDQGVYNLANLIAQLSTGIVMTGHSRKYEAEADSLASLYFEANKIGDGRQSFKQILRKLQYNQDYYSPEKQGQSLFATHPEIDSRIDAVDKSAFKTFAEDDVFYGYDEAGDLVATLTLQAQRVYTGTANPDDVGLQVIAFIESTSALEYKDQIRDMRIKTESGWLKVDNKEDTEILPNDTVGASLISNSQKSLIDRIDEIDLKLKNVASWQRASF